MKAQKIYLEHANITVKNIEECTRFFQTAFPQFKVRGGGDEGRKWIHLGDDTTYVAINEGATVNFEKDYGTAGINHIGFVVEDVDEIATRLQEAGFKRDYPKQVEKFRIRDYFADSDGNEYEFVQYLSDILEEKNSYDA